MADSSKAPTKRQLKKIVKTQESLLKKEPDNVAARVKLAGALKDLGRLSEALEHYHQVASWYRNAGRKVQALAVCRSVLEFVPDDAASLSMIAEIESPAPSEESLGTAGDAAADVSGGTGHLPPDSYGESGQGDRVSLKDALSVKAASSNSISVVTDFGGSKPGNGPVSERPRKATERTGRTDSGPGRAIGRIPIVKRAVVRRRRPTQETIKDIEPPKPETDRAGTSSPEDEATPSRPIPESVIRRTLPPEGIEAAARRAIGEEGFSEEVPTVEREVGLGPSSGDTGQPNETVEREVIPSPSPGDSELSIATQEREVGTQGLETVEGQGAGSNGAAESDVANPSDSEDRILDVGHLDAPGTDDSVVVDDSPPDGVPSAQEGAGLVRRPPPLPRDEPLIPDSFGLAEDEISEDGPMPPGEEGQGGRFRTQPLTSFLGRRPRRHTSPSLLDIREVLHAKSEDEIDVLSRDEESVFAEMADEHRRKRVSDGSRTSGKVKGRPEPQEDVETGAGTVGDVPGEAEVEEVALEDVALFKDLPDDVMAELRSRVVLRDMERGEYVVREGDPGNALFVLLAGKAVVEKTQEDKVSVLTELGPGSFFGEFALLSDRKRHASVRALGPIRIVEISRKVIGRLAKSHKEVAKVLRSFYRRRLLDTLIAATPFFNSLDEKERAAIVPRLRFKRLSPGDSIIQEGSETGGFYLVLVGRVLVTKKSRDGGVQTLAELGEGEYFGEMSLLKGRPAMASVVAAVPTELVEVAAKDFYRVVGDHPEIWQDVDKEVRRRELANHAILSGRSRSGEPGIV